MIQDVEVASSLAQIESAWYLSGEDLEKVLGHITWACLLRRESLSVFGACYSFAKRCGKRRAAVWPSVYRELRQTSFILPLMCAQASLPWDDVVLASDSSDSGYGVLERTVGAATAGRWGRVSERWRFDFEEATKARAHALSDPLNIDVESLRIQPGAIPELPASGFDEIGRDLLSRCDWRLIMHGSW